MQNWQIVLCVYVVRLLRTKAKSLIEYIEGETRIVKLRTKAAFVEEKLVKTNQYQTIINHAYFLIKTSKTHRKK